MPVTLTLACGGCEAVAIGRKPLRKRFHGTHGDHGFGVGVVDDPEALAPDGWVMFDPYTYCTYCPKCWALIEAGPESVSGQEGDE